MNTQSMIVGRLLLCAVFTLGLAGRASGKPEEKNPVKIIFSSVSMEKDCIWRGGKLMLSPPRLKFGLTFSIREPLCFKVFNSNAIQHLEATDSTGRKLAPAEFKMDFTIPQSKDGVERTTAVGVVSELPSPEAFWVRLRGTLRIPVYHLMKSPVYELALEKGAEEHVWLPGAAEQEKAGGEDIALPESMLTGRLFLEECTMGKKGRQIVLGFGTYKPFNLTRFEILNEKDEVLKSKSSHVAIRIGSPYSEWTNRLQFEEPENLKKLRIRIVYKDLSSEELVPVPVDVRLGMGGEIREGKR